MAFVVQKGTRFEIRESRATPAGARATTLATFRVLDDGVLHRARVRSTRAFDSAALRRRARALGAPVAPPDVVLAARQLLVELDRGHVPPPALHRQLAAMLPALDGGEGIGDALDDALPWVDATDVERGAALRDLLAFGDHLPMKRAAALRFPRLSAP